jgi:PKD repeat protein
MMAQGSLVVFQGNVSNIATNAGIPNHPVYIQSDSSSPGYIFTTIVYTDSMGNYHATVQVPFLFPVTFFVKTFDCNGVMHSASGISTNSSIVSNFPICQVGGPGSCTVSFTNTVSGQTVAYTAVTNSTLSAQFTWSFGEGTNGTGANVTHVYQQGGTYTITIIALFSNGCKATATGTVVVGNTLPCQVHLIT